MDVCMHVFSRDREQLLTIFQRGFHRKLQDEARRAVPGAFPTTFLLRGPLAHHVGRPKQLAPSTFRRSDHVSAPFDERGRSCLRERRPSSCHHEAIVANPASRAQCYGVDLIARCGRVQSHERGTASSDLTVKSLPSRASGPEAGRSAPSGAIGAGAQSHERAMRACVVERARQVPARSCLGGASSGTVICSTWMPCGVDSIQVACATFGCSPLP